LGATLYELLTGKPPFYQGDIIYQILECIPPPMSERRAELGVAGKEPIPETWERVISACLSKNPAARPQSAGEMLRWLDQPEIIPEITSPQPGLPVETAADKDLPPARRRGAGRRRLLFAGAGVIAVGGLAMLPATGIFAGKRPPEAPPPDRSSGKTPPAAPPLDLSSGEILPGGKTATVYEHVLGIKGGTPPYALSISDGELPAGLAMDAAGRIHGIPQTAVQARFGVEVADRNHAVARRQLSLTITPPPPPPIPPPRIVSPLLLPDGVEGATYGFSMSAEGGVPPFSWSLPSGGLPPGLELGANGVIAGTPQTAGTSEFTLKATDQAGKVAVTNVSLSIRPKPPPPIPQLGVPHENSLGMRFVASGTENVYFSKWLTRVQDFGAFVKATNYNAKDRVLALQMGVNNEAKLTPSPGLNWERPGFTQTDKHPVCCVSWDDAKKFCSWLTEKERKDGSLPAGFSYRLPLDTEWHRALCLDRQDGKKPRFPWGDEQQPANFKCNFAIPLAGGFFPGQSTGNSRHLRKPLAVLRGCHRREP
jgi:hypothetical protein